MIFREQDKRDVPLAVVVLVVVCTFMAYCAPRKPLIDYSGDRPKTYAQGVLDGKAAAVLETAKRDEALLAMGLGNYARLAGFCDKGK